jgi:uncharacterized tellurite resistance protein B-like protein
MLRKFLGITDAPAPATGTAQSDAAAAPAGSAAETATVRNIVSRLESLPPAEARYLACFAYVMSRAAQADLRITDDETAVMERFAAQYGGLDESQAVLVVGMAKLSAVAYGATEDYVVTREFRKISTPEQRLQLLRCCFAVEAVGRERDRP